jgi:hypothetical protein
MTTKCSHALTLRIQPELNDLIIEAAYDRRIAKGPRNNRFTSV